MVDLNKFQCEGIVILVFCTQNMSWSSNWFKWNNFNMCVLWQKLSHLRLWKSSALETSTYSKLWNIKVRYHLLITTCYYFRNLLCVSINHTRTIGLISLFANKTRNICELSEVFIWLSRGNLFCVTINNIIHTASKYVKLPTTHTLFINLPEEN